MAQKSFDRISIAILIILAILTFIIVGVLAWGFIEVIQWLTSK